MTPYLLTGLVYLLAGFTQGYTGFGSALIAIPLLTLFLDLKTAVPVSVLSGLAITLVLALALRRELERQKLMPLILGALPGVALGVFLLQELSSDLLRILLGGLLIAYSMFGLLFRLPRRRRHLAWACFAGFGSGLLGSTLSTIGPPAIVYTSLTPWSRDQIKATLSGFFLASTAAVACAHAFTGLITWPVISLFSAACPALLLGVALGLWVSKRTGEQDYRRVVLVLLIGMGLGLLVG